MTAVDEICVKFLQVGTVRVFDNDIIEICLNLQGTKGSDGLPGLPGHPGRTVCV